MPDNLKTNSREASVGGTVDSVWWTPTDMGSFPVTVLKIPTLWLLMWSNKCLVKSKTLSYSCS